MRTVEASVAACNVRVSFCYMGQRNWWTISKSFWRSIVSKFPPTNPTCPDYTRYSYVLLYNSISLYIAGGYDVSMILFALCSKWHTFYYLQYNFWSQFTFNSQIIYTHFCLRKEKKHWPMLKIFAFKDF